MIRRFGRIVVGVVVYAGLLAGAAGLGGCAAATIATAGSVAGLAATAVSTGADVYHLGKLDSVELAKQIDLVDAIRQTAADLHLDITREQHDKKGKWSLRLTDEWGTTIDISVERRTETMSRTRINVGLFGSEPTARLLMLRIREHLPLAPAIHARPTTTPAWPEDPRGQGDDDTATRKRKFGHP